MSPASELAGATETRGCRALWGGTRKPLPVRARGWGMRFGGLVQPPCDGVLPLLPLRWGLCPASVRRAILRLDERPTPSGDGSRFRALLAPQQADGAVPAPSQPDTIPSFFHLASLSSKYRFSHYIGSVGVIHTCG